MTIKLEPAGIDLLKANDMDPETVAGLEVKVIVQGSAVRVGENQTPEPFVIVTDMASVTSIVTDKVEEDPKITVPEEVLALFPDAKHLGDSYAEG